MMKQVYQPNDDISSRIESHSIAPLRLLVALLILRHLNRRLVFWLSMMDGIDIDSGIFLKHIRHIP